MKVTKEQREMLKERYGKVWSSNSEMPEWCAKQVSGYIEFPEGIFTMRKPHIETRFCFGEHGYDYDEVVEYCHEKSKDEGYFLSKNLGRCDAKRMLDAIESGAYHPCLYREYQSYEDSPFVYVKFERLCDMGNEIRELTEEEVENLKKFCEEEVEKFTKRLNTYLKKYGMSKCHFWTYWADR